MSNQINVINPLQSVSQAIQRLSTFSPLTGEGTKNFTKVVDALVEGKNLISILTNPVEEAGISKQQAHIFSKFLEANPLPKKLRRIKNQRVIVAQADLETINDDLLSQRDYSDFGLVGEDKVSGYKEISSSYAIERLAPFFNDAPQVVTTKKLINGSMIEKDIVAYVIPHVFFIDLKGEEEGDLIKKQRVVKEGLRYIDHEGVERRAIYAFRSPSQERVVQIVATSDHILHPVDALTSVGMDPFAFAKETRIDEEGNSVFKLDYTKAMKRFGLTLSNSVLSSFIKLGSTVIKDNKTGDFIISGGNVTVRIVEDIYSMVNQGKYKAFNKVDKTAGIFDAADHPVKQTAGDGQIYIDSYTANLISKEMGRSFQNGVVRLFSGISKGHAVKIPGLNKYFKENIIIPMSSFKASTDTLEDILPSIDSQVRIALFGSPMKNKKKFIRLPYQFTHGMKLSADSMIKLLQPHLDKVSKMLKDPTLMSDYLGLEKLTDLDLLEEDDQHEMLETSLVSVLTTFLHYAPQSYMDVYMKDRAIKYLQEMIEDWKAGSIPVEANYRFLVMDPYALLQTYKERGTKKEIRIDGELFVNPNTGLKADTVFMVASDGETIYTNEIALARNPQMVKGQSRVVTGVAPSNYVIASGKGAFDGVLVMSCHDFNAISQGGADFDGDTSLCMIQPELIEAVRSACKSAPAFLDISFEEQEDGSIVFEDGCPFPGTADMSKYTFEFTKEQYTRELQMDMYNASLDYVAETLKPNRIGELTDLSTKLSDAVRTLGYKTLDAINAQDNAQATGHLERIKQLEEMIDLLGWVQSWEIDRAKHGGAYEIELQEQLAFIENPPAEVSYFHQKSGTMRWFTPDWMGHRKGKPVNGVSVRKTDSVLSRVHQYVMKWEKEVLLGELEQIRRDSVDNNLIPLLATAISLPDSNVDTMALISSVKSIRENYNVMIKKTLESYQLALDNLSMMSFPSSYIKEKKEAELKKQLDAYMDHIIQHAVAEMHELENYFTSEQIGYVAYKEVYTDKLNEYKKQGNYTLPVSGISFAWVAAQSQLLKALIKATGEKEKVMVKPVVKKFDQLHTNTVYIGGFTPGYDAATVASMITNWSNHVAIFAQKDETGAVMHHVYVKKDRVAAVYPNYVTPFTGGTKFTAEVRNIEVKQKTLKFNVDTVTKFD